MTKKKTPAGAEGAPSTALARRDESRLARREEERAELVKELDEELRQPGGKSRAMEAILGAARALAPIFSVTSTKNAGEHFSDDGESHAISDTGIVVELLFSAGAYLARARGMTKAELFEKFEGWARDNGYD